MIVLNKIDEDLSDVKNSIANLCMKWLSNSRIEKEIQSTGLDSVKDQLVDDVKEMIGRGTSKISGNRFISAIENAKGSYRLMDLLKNYMLKGDKMGLSESLEDDPKSALSEVIMLLKDDIYGNYKGIEDPVKLTSLGRSRFVIYFTFPYETSDLDISTIDQELYDNYDTIKEILGADFKYLIHFSGKFKIELVVTVKL